VIAGIRAVSRPGRSSLFARLVGLFETSSRRQLDELHAALGRGDRRAAAAACHALKGGAGNVGAAALCKVAAELESACAAGDAASIDRLTGELDHLQPVALEALQAEALRETA
jgi:HPt (histidine-containing phosphotransfer) domain-containing protein